MPAPEAATPQVATTAAWRFDAIGTSWQVDTRGDLPVADQARIEALIEDFDRVWSRFRDDSTVAEIARASGAHELPPEADRLLDLYAGLHEQTDGAVSPLVGRTLADLGYDATYSLRPSAAPAAVPPMSTLRWEPPHLTTSEPVLLDVGAAGKGLLVDLVADELADSPAELVTIDASGDLWHVGSDPLRIALEHPLHPTRAVGVVELAAGTALCASAVNRRAWGDGLHHVLDARTGRPTRDVLATWVLADSCMVADGVATAAFFADPGDLADAWGATVVRLTADGRLESAGDVPGELFA